MPKTPEPDEDGIITEQMTFKGTTQQLEDALRVFTLTTGCPITMDYIPGGVHIWINNCQKLRKNRRRGEP